MYSLCQAYLFYMSIKRSKNRQHKADKRHEYEVWFTLEINYRMYVTVTTKKYRYQNLFCLY